MSFGVIIRADELPTGRPDLGTWSRARNMVQSGGVWISSRRPNQCIAITRVADWPAGGALYSGTITRPAAIDLRQQIGAARVQRNSELAPPVLARLRRLVRGGQRRLRGLRRQGQLVGLECACSVAGIDPIDAGMPDGLGRGDVDEFDDELPNDPIESLLGS
jgi:hypothetical protein